jgi:hypothetical protein
MDPNPLTPTGAYVPVPTGVTVPPGPVLPNIRDQLEVRLAAIIPPGHSVAVIGHADFGSGTLAFAKKVGDHWEIESDIEKRWGGDVSGEVNVVWSGK